MRDKVRFNSAQVEFLRGLFPATALGPDTSEAALRHYMGQQSVVAAVAARCDNPRMGYAGVRVGAEV